MNVEEYELIRKLLTILSAEELELLLVAISEWPASFYDALFRAYHERWPARVSEYLIHIGGDYGQQA
jgi:hypothetical protein